jgi:hypothetical protein
MWARASRSCGIACGAEAGGMGGRTLSEKVCYVIFHDMVIEAHQTTLISLLSDPKPETILSQDW